MPDVRIMPYEPAHRDGVLSVTVSAWTPVFAQTVQEVPRFVFDAFYPDGWQTRQMAEVADLLETEPESMWVACDGDTVAGFLGLRFHPEDQMGEIHILAVAPRYQRQGVGKALLRFAETTVRKRDMKMIMVETVGDRGHAPPRQAYEAFGFQPWPVARYFKEL